MYHHCLSALWGPFYSVFLSLSSRRRRRPISFIQLIPDGEDWDNENEETTSLFFVLCLFSAAALGQRERERKTRKLRNCARKSFFFTPRLFLHACYFSWPVCCLPETGIPHRKNIFFLKMHIKLLRVCQEERSTVALFPLSGKATERRRCNIFLLVLSPSLSLYYVPTRGLRGVAVAKKQIRVTVPRGLIYSRRRRELGRGKEGGCKTTTT